MDDKDLRDRIKAVDPLPPGVAMRSVTDEKSRRQLEDIVESTPNQETTTKRGAWYAVAAAAVVVVAIGAVALFNQAPAEAPLRLELAESDAMAMCLAISSEALAETPIALEGTVTSIEGDEVTLDVDEWFRGGDAAQVTLVAPPGLEALIGGIDFQEGGTYLISATDGTVNYCGFSDVSTPELRSLYEEAFS